MWHAFVFLVTLRIAATWDSPGTRRTGDGSILEHHHDSKPRGTFGEWMVSPTLWPIVMVAWLVVVPLVLIYVAVRFMVAALFGIRLRLRSRAFWTSPTHVRRSTRTPAFGFAG